MVAQFYKNESGQFVPIPGPVAPVNEVAIQASEPTDPAVKIWIDTATDGGQTAPLPIGAIIAFCGTVIPRLWHLCDGSAHGSTALLAVLGGANTPDLRSKFIIGAGATYPLLSTGGSTTHSHVLSDLAQAAINFTGTTLYARRIAAAFTAAASFTTNAQSVSTTANTTAVPLIGATNTDSTLPPYYALIYIIKKA